MRSLKFAIAAPFVLVVCISYGARGQAPPAQPGPAVAVPQPQGPRDGLPPLEEVTREMKRVDGLFTLFFSTKGSKGTGLGLFITEKIVRQHGGTITVDSAVGRGSRFGIIIPRSRKQGASS